MYVGNFLDSPATTSPLTYTVYFLSGSAGITVSAFSYNLTGTLTLTEISGS